LINFDKFWNFSNYLKTLSELKTSWASRQKFANNSIKIELLEKTSKNLLLAFVCVYKTSLISKTITLRERLLWTPCYIYQFKVKKFPLSQLLRLYHWKVVYTLARTYPHLLRNVLALEMDEPKPGERNSSPGPAAENARARSRDFRNSSMSTVYAGNATASPRYFRSAHVAESRRRFRGKYVSRAMGYNFRNPWPRCRWRIYHLLSWRNLEREYF